MNIALPLACVTLAIWVYLLFARGKFWQADCRETVSSLPDVWPEILVIVPARNEADILPATLPTILGNDYPGALHVLLIDDRSEDETAAVAERIAAQHRAKEKFTVITSKPLPSGWKGKVWAMQNGLEHMRTLPCQPRYVLFTDADIAYDNGTFTRLVAEAESGNFVLNSLMVLLRCNSLAERLLIPAFVYFFQMLYPFQWVNNPKHTLAAAAGGCILVRYDALMLSGGMMPIRGALIDDCALGRQMKRQGNIRLSLTRHVHSMRAYRKLRDIRSMVTRSAYDQLRYSPFNLVLSLLGMVLTYILPVLFTAFATGLPQIIGMLAWAGMALSFVPITRLYRRPLFQIVLLPAIALIYMAFTLDSAYQFWRGRGGLWKGRMQATTQNA